MRLWDFRSGEGMRLWTATVPEREDGLFRTCRATLASVLFVAPWSSRIVLHTEQVSARSSWSLRPTWTRFAHLVAVCLQLAISTHFTSLPRSQSTFIRPYCISHALSLLRNSVFQMVILNYFSLFTKLTFLVYKLLSHLGVNTFWCYALYFFYFWVIIVLFNYYWFIIGFLLKTVHHFSKWVQLSS